MPLLTTVASGGVKGLGWSSAQAEDLGGMVLLSPTSISYTGTSASYTTNGGLDTTECTYITPSSIFTAQYDNYLITFRGTMSTSGAYLYYQYYSYANGYKATSTYTTQYLTAYSTFVQGARSTTNAGYMTVSYATSTIGSELYLYGPFLTQPTATRAVNVSDYASAYIFDTAGTQSDSESYDTLAIGATSGTFTGTFSFYGLVGA